MNVNDWVYLGEGNLHLVARYTGQDPIFKGKVLRVLKGCEKDHESSAFKQAFLETVIQPLLGSEYVVSLTPVHTSMGFLQSLAEKVEPFRPESRKERQILLSSSTSFLLQDLSSVRPEAITFELKPKWGFKPRSSYIRTDIKSRVCRFCMHTHLKRVPQTTYCPLDLYSNDRTRVKRALRVLLHEPSMKKTLQMEGTSNLRNAEMILENILMQDPILSTLKSLQSRLDELDVEGIYPLYLEQRKELPVTNDIEVWKQVVSRFQSRSKNKNESEEEKINRIFEYVLSMTFKDCSLMINVKKTNDRDSEKTITLEDGSIYQYDIKVIDTDLKNIDKIPYWYQLDQSIVQNAIDTNFANERHCV